MSAKDERKKSAKKARQKGAEKSRNKKTSKQAARGILREIEMSKKEDEERLERITEEDVTKLKRPRFYRSEKGVLQEYHGGARLHTLKSAEEELKRRGFRRIYYTYLYVDQRKKRFCSGPCDEENNSSSEVDVVIGSWPIPVVNDGGNHVPIVVPPPPELWPEGFDDSSIAELETNMPRDWLGVLEDSSYSIDSLVRFLGADWATIDNIAVDRSSDERGAYFHEQFSEVNHLESQSSEALTELLKKRGLFDEDYFYGKVYPDDPYGNSLDEDPHRIVDGDPRELWLGPIAGAELKLLRRLTQEVVYKAFLAGREWERNSLRNRVNPTLRRDESMPKKGDFRKTNTKMFAEALKQYFVEKHTKRIPSAGKLAKFIRESGKSRWIEILEATLVAYPKSLRSWIKRQ